VLINPRSDAALTREKWFLPGLCPTAPDIQRSQKTQGWQRGSSPAPHVWHHPAAAPAHLQPAAAPSTSFKPVFLPKQPRKNTIPILATLPRGKKRNGTLQTELNSLSFLRHKIGSLNTVIY